MMRKRTPRRSPGDFSHAEYKVGFGKPPVEGQIKPGQVANPNGRRGKSGKPAAAKPDDLSAIFNAALGEKHEVSIGGVKRRLSSLEILVQRTVQDAIGGNIRARRAAFEQIQKYRGLFPTEQAVAKQPHVSGIIELLTFDQRLLPPIEGEELQKFEREQAIVIPREHLEIIRQYLRPREEIYGDQLENEWPEELIKDKTVE